MYISHTQYIDVSIKSFACVYMCMLYGYVISLDRSTLRGVGTVNDKTLEGIYICLTI